MLRSVKYFANNTIVNIHRVDDDKFGHLDFIWAKDQQTLVNKPVIDFMEEFTNPKPTEKPDDNNTGNRHHLSYLTLVFFATILVIISKFV